jgi:ABC-type multidrug transport system fused ATPase/permease subunit
MVFLFKTMDKLFPEENSSLLSKLFFFWLNPLLDKGNHNALEESDLWDLKDSIKAHHFVAEFERTWGSSDKNLFNVMLKLLFRNVVLIGTLRFLSELAAIGSPLLIQRLVQFMISGQTPTPEPIAFGYIYCFSFFVLQMIKTLFENQFYHKIWEMALKVGGGLFSLLYQKSIRLSPLARQSFSAGKVTNIVASDVRRVMQMIIGGNTIWIAALQILFISILLCVLLGYSALVGIAFLLISGPIQKKMMGFFAQLRKDVIPITDSRVKGTQEIIEGIRLIKYCASELFFMQNIEDLRKKELWFVLKRALTFAMVNMAVSAFPLFACSLTFVVYSTGNQLNVGNIFAALALFQQLRLPMAYLPSVLVGYADYKVALGRIEELLLAPESELKSGVVEDPVNAVVVANASFCWEQKEEKEKEVQVVFTLKDVNLEIPKGKLVAIVGSVGSGKSTLLNALIGETKQTGGSVSFSGSVGYAAQQAWIQNASVKENILFGSEYDEVKYMETIYACALEKDIESFQDRDDTQIGERGINLSGGQKQRINIARLVYHDPDIVMMDDPLSAVDAHVGRHLFETCLMGALKDKTRILVTHQLHFLPQVDYILVMKNGIIAEQGTFEELTQAKGEFSTLMETYGIKEEEQEEEDVDLIAGNKKDALDRIALMLTNKKIETRELMQKEDRATGEVKSSVWGLYIQELGGIGFAVATVLFLCVYQGSRILNDYWLVFWVDNTFNLTLGHYILVYLCIGVGVCLVTVCLLIWLAYRGNVAAKNLHEKAFRRMLYAPTSFFDTTPVGRIINRFSKDIESIDSHLMEACKNFLTTLVITLGAFGLIISATPWFAAPLLPVLGIYYIVQEQYRTSSRELKRIESISRSPLFSNLAETLNGISTIRAFRMQAVFVEKQESLINASGSPTFILMCAARWLSIRLESLGALLVLSCAILSTLQRDSQTLSAALVGLILTYALQVTGSINSCIRQFTEVEISMNAVERVSYYSRDLEQEAPADIEETKPSPEWPVDGTIVFDQVQMRYSSDLPLVLKGISFEIKNNEKIGVVGRTGSGKSSLIQTLFRLVEPCQGSILIDGVDTSKLGLNQLRSKLGIIPQDPVLFSGTFRRNLDPFGKYGDSELWDALDRVSIKDKVIESGGLEGTLLSGGENLSVGQRQLLCLARSMLAKPKILVMDEATANIDYDSDAIIQKSIRKDFQSSTIVTIAHRLNTVMDYDRILVLDAGEIVEFDTPLNLVQKEGGVFKAMVMETGNASNLISNASQ